MIYSENHYLTMNIVIIDSGKNHQWILKTGGWKFDEEEK